MYARRQTGFTLLELVIGIVLIAIIATAMMSALSSILLNSHDPVFRAQALAIAESYMEEIQARPFYDPDTSQMFSPEAAVACAGVNAVNRTAFDNVADYNGLNGVVSYPDCGVMPDTGGYSVAVSVQQATGSALLSGLSSDVTLLVTVTVTDPDGQTTVLSGYRTGY